ncbi:Hint domain-containing protein [Epibacterium ulvae]|uniref:Hint domain-containing protein n=1 Tax=Epibacterium ulvae TaxID=1156985 RepID=UPI001BFC9AEB|nr:Hint domain-containing protein [Epibacterium ulvae]MBT8154277.1 Hint domain-containing protein [Epibacterium ulvae]
MKTGLNGAFVLSWSQTEIDGLPATTPEALQVGSAWSWQGQAVRVDGPASALRLGETANGTDMRLRAAKIVRKMVGVALEPDRAPVAEMTPLRDSCFQVTNGVQSFTVTLIDVGPDQPPLLMFLGAVPPHDQDLWVTHVTLDPMRFGAVPARNGVICFTPGTQIATPDGPRLVEELREGDMLQTRDNGAQPLRWVGGRRMSGARLHVMPSLRPVRIRAGALGIERPEEELLVSPEHRMLIKGRHVQALFNTPEVMVAARDLVNNRSIIVDHHVRQVTYVHLLLDGHQVVWANGVETESFHPASAALEALAPQDRARLLAELPEAEHDPMRFGGFVRRNLNRSEAAILLHDAA